MTADVWWIKRTTTRFEKREENLTFIKMTYPIDVNYTWDGNAYNTLGTQMYSYGAMDVSFYDGTNTYDSTITVTHRVDTNLIEYFHFKETYARNIGMVSKYEYNVNNLILDTTELSPWPYTGLEWYGVPKLCESNRFVVTYKLIEYGLVKVHFLLFFSRYYRNFSQPYYKFAVYFADKTR
jgi:hypothetical protein